MFSSTLWNCALSSSCGFIYSYQKIVTLIIPQGKMRANMLWNLERVQRTGQSSKHIACASFLYFWTSIHWQFLQHTMPCNSLTMMHIAQTIKDIGISFISGWLLKLLNFTSLCVFIYWKTGHLFKKPRPGNIRKMKSTKSWTFFARL